jgi:GNAT superfamily N-acetyltransferase
VRLNVAPFDRGRDLEEAAMLLAGRHRRDRVREPLLPAAFETPDACRAQIEPSFQNEGWCGVSVRLGGDLAGYAIAAPQVFAPTHLLANFFPARGASLGYAAHAAREGSIHDVYREMYAALAEDLVSRGIFDHAVSIPAADPESAEAWTSLGFGRNLTCAIRGVDPPARAAASTVDMHAASAEDADVIFALNEELSLHHVRSPIFNPYMRESDLASHDFQKNLLADAAANAHWVGYHDGRPVGMNTFMQPFFLSPMTVPEKTVYLFQGIVSADARAGGVGTAILAGGVGWAREQGYEHVALHFASANVSGARFWQSSGFRPIEHGMRRHIDERIAWANR